MFCAVKLLTFGAFWGISRGFAPPQAALVGLKRSPAYLASPSPSSHSMPTVSSATHERLFMVFSQAVSGGANNSTDDTTIAGIERAIAAPSAVRPQDARAINRRNSLWFCHSLALNSGILNGLFLSGIMGRTQAVGPVTDSWTKSAMGFAVGDVTNAIFIVKVLLSFGSGAFTQGLLNPEMEVFDISHRTRSRPLWLMSGMMALAAGLVFRAASKGAGAAPEWAFFLVCATNGMQNSFSSFLTQNLCRTSHFTGTTTDLFTILGQCARGNTANAYKIKTYSGLAALFALGGFLGTRWTRSMGRAAIFLAASSAWFLLSSMPWQQMVERFNNGNEGEDLSKLRP